MPRRQTEEDIQKLLSTVSSDDDGDFSPDSDDDPDYILDRNNDLSSERSSSGSDEECPLQPAHVMDETSPSNCECHSAQPANSIIQLDETAAQQSVIWKTPSNTFVPRLQVIDYNEATILCDVSRASTELDIFLKLFPMSLFIHIADCTNRRIKLWNEKKNKNEKYTDKYEIMSILACSVVMCYNRVPELRNYWSNNESLGNSYVKKYLSRDRTLFLFSKLYFADPNKPDDSSKSYFIDDVLNCLKITYQKCRSNSTHQSIDESMVKFKGRSALKQYIPLKPIKRGIKIWTRSDSLSGYVYDMNIYKGKENETQKLLLGERVVHKLMSSIPSGYKVSVCFDRFFTSVNLMDTVDFPAVGTYISARKNTPIFPNTKMNRGDCNFRVNNSKTLACQWQDTKTVFLLSNCHKAEVSLIQRLQKDGSRINVNCPEAVIFYNKYMGGVDLSDQKATCYDFDRKSMKWWKKVFYRLLQTSICNASIIYSETNHVKCSIFDFMVPLSEQMMKIGYENTAVKKRIPGKTGRPSKKAKLLTNVGSHLPIEQTKRRRCVMCAEQKIEKRTHTVCADCDKALCKNCFAPYHK